MGGMPATVAFTVLWPTVVPWLAAAMLPLLLAWLPVRHGTRIRWAATELVAAAAKRAGLGRHGIPTLLVALRAVVLAAVALAAARPFLGPRSPSRGVPLVAGVTDRAIEIVVADPAAGDEAAIAIRRSLEALAVTPSTLASAGVPTVEVVSPQAAGAASAGRRLIILCDGVVPDAADAARIDDAVRAGASLLVCVGPDSTSPILRPRLSTWLQGLVEIDIAGAVRLPDAAIDARGLGDDGMVDLFAGPTVTRSAEIAFPANRWTVLAQTRDGSRPLIVEAAVGKGRVCIATIPLTLPGAGPDDAWSDLAAWPAFVPFVDRLASHLLAPAGGETVAALSPLSGAALARPLLAIAAAAILAEWVLSVSLASAAVPWLGRAALLAACGGMALLWGGTPRAWPSRDGRRRPVALVVDASPSMATRDVEGGGTSPRSRIAAAQEAFARDGGRAMRALARGRGLTLSTTGTWSAEEGDGGAALAALQSVVPSAEATHASRLGDAVASLLTAADPPAAVVVASDGAISDGSSWADVARLARRRRVPLVAIPIGSDTADDDQPLPMGFRFTGIEGSAVCRPDERLPLAVTAAATVPHRSSLPLAATNGSGSLAPRATADDAALLYRFAGRCDDRIAAANGSDAATMLTQTVRLGATADQGHAATLPIVVASAPIRVLLVDTAARYEYRFLDRLLAGDPRFEVSSVLLASRDRKDARPTGSLPASIDGWNAFDVIVIGDVPIATAADDDAAAWAALAEAAVRHGIGIAWLPGRRWARDDAGLRSWLPATPRAADSRSERPHRLAIAGASNGGGWFSFLDDRPPAAGPFAPEVYAVLDAIDYGPGSRVVAVATDQQAPASAPLPAMISARHGAATVLAHFCETWRWRDAAGDDLHARYWLHALGRLAERHLLGRLVAARLEARPCDPIAGETVWVDVVPTRDDMSLAGWAVEVEKENGQPRHVSLDVSTAGATATIPLAGLPAGRHAVRLVSPGQSPAETPATIRREIIVNEPARETAGGPAGSGPFAAAARLSGGAVVPLDRLDTLPDTISRLDADRSAATARSGPRWFESQVFAHLLLAATVATGLMAWRPRSAGA